MARSSSGCQADWVFAEVLCCRVCGAALTLTTTDDGCRLSAEMVDRHRDCFRLAMSDFIPRQRLAGDGSVRGAWVGRGQVDPRGRRVRHVVARRQCAQKSVLDLDPCEVVVPAGGSRRRGRVAVRATRRAPTAGAYAQLALGVGVAGSQAHPAAAATEAPVACAPCHASSVRFPDAERLTMSVHRHK